MLKLQAFGAGSINIQADRLMLPKSGKMYMYNPDFNMIMGPIETDVLFNNNWASDQIYGDEVTLAVLMNAAEKENFQISIASFTYGLIKYSNRAFGDSAPCNQGMNVRCPEYNIWSNFKDAVCLMLTAEGELCTGTLMNNDCIDYRPFILTAEHCLDHSQVQNNPDNLIFRFGYESTDCFPPREPRSWISFYGATERARWDGSDFALLEMNGSVIGQTQIGFAGWDRSDLVPDNFSYFIHHPRGDVKKIAFNWEGGTLGTNLFLGIPANNTIRHTWNHTIIGGSGFPSPGSEGILEPGSSGSPMFSHTNGRVLGQLIGGDAVGFPNCEDEFNTWHGRFFSAWLGGGTLNTSLIMWLGSNYNPTTTDFVRAPALTGPSQICSGNAHNYSVLFPPPNRLNRTWSVSPPHLFTGATTGTGTSASLTAANGASGLATITFTMTGDIHCNPFEISRNIWVGTPPSGEITVLGQFGDIELCTDGIYTIHYSNATPFFTASSYNWSVPGFLNILSGQGTQDLVVQTPSGWPGYMQNYGTVSVTVTNPCGQTIVSKPLSVKYCDGGGAPASIVVHPNPAANLVSIEFDLSIDFNLGESLHFTILDASGKVIYRKSVESNTEVIDISHWASGVYQITLEGKDNRHSTIFVKSEN